MPVCTKIDVKRATVERLSSHLGRNAADDNRAGDRKRKREEDQNEHTDEEENEAQDEDNKSLKRKWDHEPEMLINLGETVHSHLNTNFLGPALKRRLMGSSP